MEVWGSVVTPGWGSPLSSGAGSLQLIRMQGTRRQAAAAAYRQNPAEKGQRDGGGRLRKNQQKAKLPLLLLSPLPPLWSSKSLILNLRLASPRRRPCSHPILTTPTQTPPHAQLMQLPLALFLSSQSMNGQTGTKPDSSPLRKSNHWV